MHDDDFPSNGLSASFYNKKKTANIFISLKWIYSTIINIFYYWINNKLPNVFSYSFVRRSKAPIYELLFWGTTIIVLGNIVMTVAFTLVAMNNYPGGVAIIKWAFVHSPFINFLLHVFSFYYHHIMIDLYNIRFYENKACLNYYSY